MLRADDIYSFNAYRCRLHTYKYTRPNGVSATSRIDRWYVNGTACLWAVDIEVDKYGLFSDHNGILLPLRSQDNPVRIKTPPRIFPVLKYARARVDNCVAETLDAFAEKVDKEVFSAQEVCHTMGCFEKHDDV